MRRRATVSRLSQTLITGGVLSSILLAFASSIPVALSTSAASPSGDAPVAQLFLPQIGRKATAPDLRRVTDTLGTETQPALSPDNQQVVYVGVNAGGGTDLFLVNLSGGAPINLTNTPSIAEETPVFAPDGSAIAFGRNSGDDWDIYSIAPDGTDLRAVVTNAGSDETHPAFAPDGKTLMFDSNRAEGNWDIYTADLSTGVWTKIIASPAADRFPVIGLGGRYVIFRSEQDGNSEIYRVTVDAPATIRRLTADPVFDGYPAATPAHQGIAFVKAGSIPQIWQMNDASGGATALLPGSGWSTEAPRLSQDGTQIVYAASPAGEGMDIFLSPYASPLQQIGDVSFAAADCSWEGGVLALGWARAWQSTGNTIYWDWIKQWVDGCDRSGKQVEHVNDLLFGYGALVVFARDPQQKYMDIAQAAADYAMGQAPRAADGTLIHLGDAIWPDTLILAIPFLVRMGLVTGETQYTQEAIVQMNLHSQHLQDSTSALYRHAWPAVAGGVDGPAHWGRGNGWAMASAAEILRLTPEGTDGRDTVLANFRRHADALLAAQAAGGLWATVVDQPAFYLETSGTALAGAALLEGVAQGWLDASRFGIAAAAARDGTLAQIQAGGKVGGVSGPTGPMLDVTAYNAIPTDVLTRYGQGSALLIGAADLDAATTP